MPSFEDPPLDPCSVVLACGGARHVAGEMERSGALCPFDAWETDAGRGRRRQGSDRLERQGGTAGVLLDVPLGHQDDPWSFPHFDMVTVAVADAPRPAEIVVTA